MLNKVHCSRTRIRELKITGVNSATAEIIDTGTSGRGTRGTSGTSAAPDIPRTFFGRSTRVPSPPGGDTRGSRGAGDLGGSCAPVAPRTPGAPGAHGSGQEEFFNNLDCQAIVLEYLVPQRMVCWSMTCPCVRTVLTSVNHLWASWDPVHKQLQIVLDSRPDTSICGIHLLSLHYTLFANIATVMLSE